jgi:hypothetical protein
MKRKGDKSNYYTWNASNWTYPFFLPEYDDVSLRRFLDQLQEQGRQ